jgi:hypothetical protein
MINKEKRQRFLAGAIVKIPMGDGFHTYGRLLVSPFVEIYDFRTRDEVIDLEMILAKPVLFTLSVHKSALYPGEWEIIGKLPFDEKEVKIPLHFWQNDSDLMDCQLKDRFDNFYPATIKDCRGLERIVNWDPHHVVDRIRDHYAGVPNVWVELYRVREIGEEEL